MLKKSIIILAGLALLVSALIVNKSVGSVRAEDEDYSQGFDQAPRIAIMSAFGAELEAYKSAADIEKTVVVNGRKVYIGTFVGHKVVMTNSGVSMVNAAMSAQAILDHFKVTKIVFSGIAGGVNPDLHIGDVAIPAQWSEYQENRFVRELSPGEFQIPPNQVLPCYGMMCPQTVRVTSVLGQPDEQTRYTWFEADSALVTIAEEVAPLVVLEDCTEDGVCLEEQPVVVVGGNGVSGPTFVDNADYREYVWDTWQADALDMESAAVAHVAKVNEVPFIFFRSLSDLAGGGEGANQIGTFFQLAAINSARVMAAFMEALPED